MSIDPINLGEKVIYKIYNQEEQVSGKKGTWF